MRLNPLEFVSKIHSLKPLRSQQDFEEHCRFLSIFHSLFVSPMFVVDQYVDHQLQRGGRGISEEELEKTLDGVMNILRFVEGKDVFQAFYKKDLAKRLLLNTSSSYEAEKVSWCMLVSVVTCYILVSK